MPRLESRWSSAYPALRDGVRYNAAGVLRDGVVEAEYRKMKLPNYSVFDEHRYFEPGVNAVVFDQGHAFRSLPSARTSGTTSRCSEPRRPGAGTPQSQCLTIPPGQGNAA